jgi:Domain of unknown function (DUF4129)
VTASQRRTVTVLVAALGAAFLLVWAAAAGPQQVVVQHTQSVVEPPVDQQGVADQPATEQEKPQGHTKEPRSAGQVTRWIQDLVAFLLMVAALFVAAMLLRQLFLRIRRSLGDERLVVPLEPLPDLDVARSVVEREHERQLEALATSDVRNGIVACWVVFEEAAAESHVVKQPAETASAFVVRFLHSLDVDPRPVGQLAQLFLEARFSSHPMADDARPRAEQALAAIHRDLVRSGATP